MDRSFCIVFVRSWPPEVTEHAIAHELCDMALEPTDLSGDSILVSPQQIPHVLRVYSSRERGRADQVAEQDGKLATLGLAVSGLRFWSG